jgi:methyltransferase (TIGR00027 family)
MGTAELRASRTAVLVCQARAVADGRVAVGRFADPIALRLLRADERAAVDLARGDIPRRWQDRVEFELLAATADVLTARTVAIDDAVRERQNPQLVILGAGLDARGWRMPELAAVQLFEVDQPASQQDKRARLGELAPAAKSVRFVPVEFGRDALGAALDSAGHDRSRPTTWIWEGVLPYLTHRQSDSTLAEIAACSAAGSRLVATYSTRLPVPDAGRLALRILFGVARRSNPMAHERHVSAWQPEQMRELLAAPGWRVVSDVDQLTLARGLAIPVRRPRTLANGRVVVADR